MSRHWISAALAASLLAGPALAANTPPPAQGIEEIVVTAGRMADYDPVQTPQTVLHRRADNLITDVTVICDTRELSRRKEELRATLRNMIRAAGQDKRIALGVGDEVVGAFDETMLDQVIVPDGKADTSRATVLVKTAIGVGDSFDMATGRIKDFVKRTTKVGRTEVLLNSGWELTLINPNQYRFEVIKLVADDARKTAAAFGDAYGVEVLGLQLPVSWYQSGPLELALYVPYKLTVRPRQP
jgi:hypothetical protein